MNRNRMMFLNSIVVIITSLLNIVLGIVSIKLFLDAYGTEISGLIQAGNQVLRYLILLEAGLCAAYLYKFYKPVASNDFKKISELYIGFRKTMNKVVFKMLIAAFLISLIYPLLINENEQSYYTTLSIFILLSIRFIIPYFFILVPKYMIILKEMRYKAEFITGISKSIIFLTEILILIYWKPSIQLLLLISIFFAIALSSWFKILMNKMYKNELNYKANPDYEPNKMSKDVLAHNVSSLAMNSTDNIVLSIMTNLTQVFIYSAYNSIMSQISTLVQSIIDGASATLGLKISRNDSNSYYLFREILVGTYFIAGLTATVFIININLFIELWIGSAYILEWFETAIFGIILYINIILTALMIARNAKGLYSESKNFTILQAILNFILTISLVPIFGILGALLGTVIARVGITVPMTYNLVYKSVFPKEENRATEWIGNILVSFLCVFSSFYISTKISLDQFILVQKLFIQISIVSIVSFIILFIYYWIFDKGFRRLIKRVLNIIYIKFK